MVYLQYKFFWFWKQTAKYIFFTGAPKIFKHARTLNSKDLVCHLLQWFICSYSFQLSKYGCVSTVSSVSWSELVKLIGILLKVTSYFWKNIRAYICKRFHLMPPRNLQRPADIWLSAKVRYWSIQISRTHASRTIWKSHGGLIFKKQRCFFQKMIDSISATLNH